MTKQEKKAFVQKQIADGSKYSYNELMADLELQLWSQMHGGIRKK